jgi:hypothetical protein
MIGIAWGLFALSVTVTSLGTVAGLVLALVLPIAWNLGVWMVQHRLMPVLRAR